MTSPSNQISHPYCSVSPLHGNREVKGRREGAGVDRSLPSSLLPSLPPFSLPLAGPPVRHFPPSRSFVGPLSVNAGGEILICFQNTMAVNLCLQTALVASAFPTDSLVVLVSFPSPSHPWQIPSSLCVALFDSPLSSSSVFSSAPPSRRPENPKAEGGRKEEGIDPRFRSFVRWKCDSQAESGSIPSPLLETRTRMEETEWSILRRRRWGCRIWLHRTKNREARESDTLSLSPKRHLRRPLSESSRLGSRDFRFLSTGFLFGYIMFWASSSRQAELEKIPQI